MNDRYFACKTCKLYIDAGYRWTTLLPKTMLVGQPLDVSALFAATEYWAGVEGDERLKRLLAGGRQFVAAHQDHDLFYGEHEQFHGLDIVSLAWMEVGFEAQQTADDFAIYDWSPRFFAEVLGYTDWSQIVECMDRNEESNWWYHQPELRFEGRQVFEYFVKRAASEK